MIPQHKRGLSGSKNPFWKGGRSIASTGYVLIRVGTDHHLADVRGYAYEHRIVAEQNIGRRLTPDEIVHHIDGNKQNNHPANLEVMPSAAHHHFEHRSQDTGLRKPDEPNPTVTCECGCGRTFSRYDATKRPRRYMPGHNPIASPTADAICAALAGQELSNKEIAARCGVAASSLKTALWKLKKQGRIVSLGRGRWGRAT